MTGDISVDCGPDSLGVLMRDDIAITNSKRPEAIGDCLSAFPAVHAVGAMQVASRIMARQVFFSCAAVRPLFHGCALTVDEQPENAFVVDVQDIAESAEKRGLHLTQAWYDALGLVPPELPVPWPVSLAPSIKAGCDVWLAPFSASDCGYGTKTWDGWGDLVALLRAAGLQVGVVQGIDDVNGMELDVDAWITGAPLDIICRILRPALAVVTLDNGVNWLAQLCGARHVLLQAANHHPHWTCDPNPGAVNLHSVRTIIPEQVFDAVMGLVG